jgi:hypothetical protein
MRLAFSSLLAAAIVVPACVDAATSPRVHMAALQVSSNWAGYVATARTAKAKLAFTSVQGSWRVPHARCTAAGGTSAAFWVGIGGFGVRSPSLQQLGVSTDCAPGSGTPRDLAWTEIVPAPAIYAHFTVKPGDLITASVAMQGRKVILTMRNVTRKTRFARTFVVKHALDTSSAEWIAEAPSLCRTSASCTVLPLTNFGTVRFSGAAATAAGHSGGIADPAWLTTPLALVTSNGFADYVDSNPAGALPRPLSAARNAFAVGYRSSLSVANSPVPASPFEGAPLPPWYH